MSESSPRRARLVAGAESGAGFRLRRRFFGASGSTATNVQELFLAVIEEVLIRLGKRIVMTVLGSLSVQQHVPNPIRQER